MDTLNNTSVTSESLTPLSLCAIQRTLVDQPLATLHLQQSLIAESQCWVYGTVAWKYVVSILYCTVLSWKFILVSCVASSLRPSQTLIYTENIASLPTMTSLYQRHVDLFRQIRPYRRLGRRRIAVCRSFDRHIQQIAVFWGH